MFGLAVIMAFSLYLVLSYIVVRMAARYAREHGRSSKRWGWGAALVMYLLVFWDWIPTIIAHHYYCATEAGLWADKTVEQSRKDNAKMAEPLPLSNVLVPIHQGDGDNWTNTYILNQRIRQVGKHLGPMFPHVWRYETELVDIKDQKTLVRLIDFSASQNRAGGGWNGWKFWLSAHHCHEYGERARRFGDLRNGILED